MIVKIGSQPRVNRLVGQEYVLEVEGTTGSLILYESRLCLFASVPALYLHCICRDRPLLKTGMSLRPSLYALYALYYIILRKGGCEHTESLMLKEKLRAKQGGKNA